MNYQKLGKCEIIVSLLLFIFLLVYSILENYQVNLISSDFVLLVWMISIAYLFFNRIVKLLVNRNKNNFYSTYAYIQSTKFIYAGKGSYLSYVIKYEDENSNTHIKELDGFFTIRNLIAGDKIKININKNNPNNITVAYSDLIVAIILCVIGIVFESIIIVVYVLAH